LGYRIPHLRVVTLGSMVAIAGVSIPSALVAAPPAEPVPLTAGQFRPVVVPAAPAAATHTIFASRLPSSELRDTSRTALAPAASSTPHAVTERAPKAHAATVAVRVVKKPAAPKPAHRATHRRTTAHTTARTTHHHAVTFSTAGASAARSRVVRIALAQRGDRYVSGGVGPSSFDCSGLVRYAYNQAGVGGRLGGGHSASAMLAWGRSHGLTSRSNGRIGDVVIYGNGSHAGIYIGNGRIISALNPRQGIRVTGLYALGAPFTTFIHTHI
jgi:cell wall-associated NlpC family hydrolase